MTRSLASAAHRRLAPIARALGPSLGLLVVIQLGVVAARAVLRPAPTVARPVVAKLMPAARGAITELAIQFHAPGSAEILGVYHQLFRALHRDTHVRVVVGTDEDRATFEAVRRVWYPDGDGPRVRYVAAGRAITSWIHDRFAVLEGESDVGAPTTVLAPPVAHTGPAERVADWFVPWDLKRDAGESMRVRMAPFAFDGGDLVADERFAFVTTRLLRRARVRSGDEAAFVRVVEQTVGRPVVLLGDERRPVPDHHVGMLILPMGNRTVLVGDAALAIRALRDGGILTDREDETPVIPDVGGRPLALDLRPERIREIANVATLLEERDFTVVRVPMLPSAEGPYVYVSYTNAMVERRAGVVRVTMPTYGIEPLDRLATTVVSSLGARVYPVRVERIFRMGGSLGCLVAPLVRSCEGSGPRGTSECAHGFGTFRRAPSWSSPGRPPEGGGGHAGEWPRPRSNERSDLVGDATAPLGRGPDDGLAPEGARGGAGARRGLELRVRLSTRSGGWARGRRQRHGRRHPPAARRDPRHASARRGGRRDRCGHARGHRARRGDRVARHRVRRVGTRDGLRQARAGRAGCARRTRSVHRA
ncbi:MAG: hypothetical protein IT379_29845 [Deltaproteobacteria bacterium]|nr:hypothetical protein [Deltaproteobacteria bacterium]